MPTPTLPSPVSDPLAGLAVFERGWLSSNNVLVHAAAGEAGAVLVDSSHVNHAAQTLALVQAALAGRPLALLANTHLHSDHCGGNTLLQQTLGVPVALPPGQAEAVRRWDENRLSHHATGQRLGRFTHQRLLQPGELLVVGGRAWEIIAAPGHDPDMVMLFDRAHGVLISADALWENGFGVIFPEIAGEPGFDDMHAVLDRIARLPVRLVIPGHGRPFADVEAALQRAGQRLQGFVREPARHARHAMKVLLKYRLMEEREQPLPVLQQWAAATPLVQGLWQRFAPAGVAGIDDWVQRLVAELATAGVVSVEGQQVRDA
ncbi:MBL fold metallo-hydrolase [Pseudorhodoferax sp.]|uniref:MBL fold metallo-hydrolase n=1 Tax=Pseudorhodoferax sp. TaxID=1993553 RepID=UPI002DD69ED2|nr:MBL fold metallo-hydrolase [Pseudorhodoferax sp.]